jgi:hypothetical protein
MRKCACYATICGEVIVRISLADRMRYYHGATGIHQGVCRLCRQYHCKHGDPDETIWRDRVDARQCRECATSSGLCYPHQRRDYCGCQGRSARGYHVCWFHQAGRDFLGGHCGSRGETLVSRCVVRSTCSFILQPYMNTYVTFKNDPT